MSDARIAYERCPLCEGDEAEEVGVASCATHPLYRPELPATMRWIRCDACRHVFVDGYFGERAQQLLFANAHPSQLPGPDTVGGRAVAAKIVDAVSSVREAWSGRWLDVRCGNGALLATAAEYGYDVVGIDPREEAVRRTRELGFDARTAELGLIEEPEDFDVISMVDALEHMPFPKIALVQAKELLRPGGALFISTPNTECLAWKELDREKKNPYWGELEHFHAFGRSRLYALLREHGLLPIRYGISQRYLASMEIIARKVA